LLNFLKKNKFLFFNFELNNSMNNGPNPIKIIQKYLKKTSHEYLCILCLKLSSIVELVESL